MRVRRKNADSSVQERIEGGPEGRGVKKPKFSLRDYKDAETVALLREFDQKALGRWAIDCAERAMPYFEAQYPDDRRPRIALETLREWIDSGRFSMAVIRKASLDAHAAAKEIGNDSPAASAAHAAGQAVATAHVALHALGAANYALQAIHRASDAEAVAGNLKLERNWQLRHLRSFR